MLSLPFSVVQVMQNKAAAATQAWCHLFPSDTSSLLGLTFFFPNGLLGFFPSYQHQYRCSDGFGSPNSSFSPVLFSKGMGGPGKHDTVIICKV